jgi:hypothetical protein
VLCLEDRCGAAFRVATIHSLVRAGAESLEGHTEFSSQKIADKVFKIGMREREKIVGHAHASR